MSKKSYLFFSYIYSKKNKWPRLYQLKMSIFGQTFDKWIKYRIVQAGILLIVTISVIFLYLPQIVVVEFWIEILALFFALIFGFYWERAHESILHEKN